MYRGSPPFFGVEFLRVKVLCWCCMVAQQSKSSIKNTETLPFSLPFIFPNVPPVFSTSTWHLYVSVSLYLYFFFSLSLSLSFILSVIFLSQTHFPSICFSQCFLSFSLSIHVSLCFLAFFSPDVSHALSLCLYLSLLVIMPKGERYSFLT